MTQINCEKLVRLRTEVSPALRKVKKLHTEFTDKPNQSTRKELQNALTRLRGAYEKYDDYAHEIIQIHMGADNELIEKKYELYRTDLLAVRAVESLFEQNVFREIRSGGEESGINVEKGRIYHVSFENKKFYDESSLYFRNVSEENMNKAVELISQLPRLKRLNLTATKVSELPEDLSRLEVLRLKGCINLKGLPANLSNIKLLSITDCPGIKSLPDPLPKSLKWLHVSGSGVTNNPSEVERIKNFKSNHPQLQVKGL